MRGHACTEGDERDGERERQQVKKTVIQALNYIRPVVRPLFSNVPKIKPLLPAFQA